MYSMDNKSTTILVSDNECFNSFLLVFHIYYFLSSLKVINRHRVVQYIFNVGITSLVLNLSSFPSESGYSKVTYLIFEHQSIHLKLIVSFT